MVRNECNQSGHGTLKLNVSQDWIDEMNWYFACWWKSGKAKSYFNDFWVDVVKNRHGHLVQELLKFAEWVIELIFVCWMWCNNVWLDQHRTLYIWLLNVSLLQLYLLKPLAVAGRTLWNSVCLSFPLDTCLGVFLESCIKPLWSCAWQPDFLEKLFLLQKLGKWTKNRFFEFF